MNLTEPAQGNVALLGDACHQTLPYQAQGAAMAVEDGAVLGRLLGMFHSDANPKMSLAAVLQLYERLRKTRTTTNVQAASSNRKMFHMSDGPEQVKRDAELKVADYTNPSAFRWLDPGHNMDMLGFDAIQDSEKAYGVEGSVAT